MNEDEKKEAELLKGLVSADEIIKLDKAKLDIPKNIPKPPKFSKEELRKKLNSPTKDTGWREPNTFLKYYSIPIFIFICMIGGLFFIVTNSRALGFMYMIVLIFYAGILIPFGLGIIAYFILRLVAWDRNKLTGKIIVNVSKNFFIMNFFKPNKRIIKRVVLIDSDGISIKYEDKRYIIDMENTWLDENNYPNGYFLPNLPQQLSFNFAKYLISISKDNPNPLTDDGEKIEVTYSSKNLEVFKKDKLFFEFHQQITPETMKLLYFAFGLIGVAFLVIFLLVVILKK